MSISKISLRSANFECWKLTKDTFVKTHLILNIILQNIIYSRRDTSDTGWNIK
jgi:regulatory protein YycI of two-component signal transduction system YycFG